MKKIAATVRNATIVAEVSTTWVGGTGGPPISTKFERVIVTNAKRGYRLHSWRFCQTASYGSLIETIVAVFKR